MLVLLRGIALLKALRKECCPGLLRTSSAQKHQSMADTPRFLYRLVLVEDKCGPMGTISLKFLEISAL